MVPGVTVAKWTRAWQERRRNSPLIVTPISEAEQIEVLHDGRADLSFVRLPIEREGLSVIRLYGEVAVVVVAKEHPVSLFESVTEAELESEVVRTEDPADAVEVVAAGVGVLRVPHSVARLHARKDVVAVPVSDAAETEIAVVWLAENTTPDIEEFVGIVRGRRPGSSRGPAREEVPTASDTKPVQKKPAQKQGGGAPKGGGKAKAKPAAKHPPKSKARGRKKTGR
ncbi:LysR substrate binding domain-containing protein [Homoserinimonas aerilata]|uniref:LysR substrate binding domain-containing protein n=2 Tax=Homoserinimonas aerilata TaxID=1162970 RepID=A0A542YJ19_9MICO|nr:LysR substrate binding domain-containing protein [Homoserinimonas aerilata]